MEFVKAIDIVKNILKISENFAQNWNLFDNYEFGIQNLKVIYLFK